MVRPSRLGRFSANFLTSVGCCARQRGSCRRCSRRACGRCRGPTAAASWPRDAAYASLISAISTPRATRSGIADVVGRGPTAVSAARSAGGVQHDLDVVVAGVLGQVQAERLQPLLVGRGRGVDGDQLRAEDARRALPWAVVRVAVSRAAATASGGEGSGEDGARAASDVGTSCAPGMAVRVAVTRVNARADPGSRTGGRSAQRGATRVQVTPELPLRRRPHAHRHAREVRRDARRGQGEAPSPTRPSTCRRRRP